VTETNVFRLSQPGTFADPLNEALRTGARALMAQAVEAEVAALGSKDRQPHPSTRRSCTRANPLKCHHAQSGKITRPVLRHSARSDEKSRNRSPPRKPAAKAGDGAQRGSTVMLTN
jgi:hypothetical protein